MKVYLIVFIITMLLQIIPAKSSKQQIIKLVITFIPLFLFGALRVDFGYDYESYEDEFYSCKAYGIDQAEHSEVGYQLLNIICPSFRFLLVVQSLFVCLAYGFFFYKYIPNKQRWLALLLLFLSGQYTIFFMFSGIRNAITISLLILVVPLIEHRRIILFAVITFLASLFHTSALIVFPIVYFISRTSLMTDKEYYIWLFLMGFFIVIPIDLLFGNFSYVINFYFERYNPYLSKISEFGFERTPLIILSTSLLGLGILLNARKTTSERELLLSRMALIGVYANYLGSMNLRLTNYMQFFIVAMWAILIINKKIKWRYLYMAFAILYLSYAFFNVFIGDPNFIYEKYQSIFN